MNSNIIDDNLYNDIEALTNWEKICPQCNGDGSYPPPTRMLCTFCGGKRKVAVIPELRLDCPGDGIYNCCLNIKEGYISKRPKERCSCKGLGYIPILHPHLTQDDTDEKEMICYWAAVGMLAKWWADTSSTSHDFQLLVYILKEKNPLKEVVKKIKNRKGKE